MLVEFAVKNFRSFKEQQTLSLVTDNKDISIATDFKRVPHLLKKVSIMGPNASGKSNLLVAMNVAKQLICTSHKMDIGERIPVQHYLLNENFKNKPSEFEFVFLLNDVLYQYGFAATSKEITEEWLFATRKGGNLQKWILRSGKDEKQDWYITSHLKGRRKEWINETRENTLLLSIIGTLKHNEIVREIIQYFKNIGFLSSQMNLCAMFTKIASYEEEGMKEKVINFLKKADLGIIDLEIDANEITNETLKNLDIPETLKKDILGTKSIDSAPIHRTEEKKRIEFDFDKHESEGTRRLFSLAYPIIDTLEKGRVLLIDEIDNSMHFKEIEFIESLFSNQETNPKGAQLISTTHDVTVLSRSKRDEIYFVEKIDGFSSHLYPLSDYENRNDVPYMKRYLSGQYDAFPHIGMGV